MIVHGKNMLLSQIKSNLSNLNALYSFLLNKAASPQPLHKIIVYKVKKHQSFPWCIFFF